MKRRNFLKHIGLAASLPCLVRAAQAQPARPETTKSARHKILSCNVRVDVPQDSAAGDGWQHRKDLCIDVIRAQQADLIGLQEAQTLHLDDLKNAMPEYDSYALSYATARFHPANAILFRRARYELISAGGFWLSEAPHVAASKAWDTANPRFVNWVDLKERGSGKELRFWNTHLDHKGAQARIKGAALISEAVAVFPRELPQLLAGDMNTEFTNPAIQNFTGAGWRETYRAVHGPDDPGFTFHGFKGPAVHARRPDGTAWGQIDFIFCRGDAKPLGAEILRDGRNGRYPSDHYFVSAVVEL